MTRCTWAIVKAEGLATRCTKEDMHIYDYGDSSHVGRELARHPWRRIEWYWDDPAEFETERDDFWAWRVADE